MSIVSMSEKEIKELLQTSVMDEKRKNKYAEVMTPLFLVEEILDHIPESVYSEPDWKWLDPAAGTGHFFLVLYLRLMKGLEKKFVDEKARKKHILENMLYMVELNGKNVTILKQRFGNNCHIYQADFLTHDFKSMQFNGILGNPPFQISKKGVYKGSVGNRVLWTFFIKNVLEKGLLKANGYFGFLTPSSWRRPEQGLYSLMVQENYLRFLHIYSKKEGLDKLSVQSRFDVYVIENRLPREPSFIIDEKGKKHRLVLSKWPFLPNYDYDSFQKILVPKAEGLDILFDSSCYDARKLKKKKTKRNDIEVVHNITRKGLGLRYGSKKCLHLHKPKLLLNFNEKQYPVIDTLGKYGMSQLTFGIPIQNKEDGLEWKEIVESPFFQDIIKASKWSSFQTDYRMFSYFSKNKKKYRNE